MLVSRVHRMNVKSQGDRPNEEELQHLTPKTYLVICRQVAHYFMVKVNGGDETKNPDNH
jgi:hypothetical protein